MRKSAGLLTQIPPSCDEDVVVQRILWHLNRLVKPTCTSPNEKLTRWRLVIRAAQDAYEKELQQLEDLNSVKADPALEVPVVG